MMKWLLLFCTRFGGLSQPKAGLDVAHQLPARYSMAPLHTSAGSPAALLAATTNRHCAYCLSADAMSLCSGCHRRAYCSKECCAKDAVQGAGGQVHSLWCSLPCGEEDIDWAVKPIAGKGLGVVALRDMPRFTRIMVDGMRRDDHPAIVDLMPLGASRQAKIDLNGFTATAGGKQTQALYLRGARINHCCTPNAFSSPDQTKQCTSIIACADIQAGQEITIAYKSFSDAILSLSDGQQTPPAQQEIINYLRDWHGIQCPADCLCRDKQAYIRCVQAFVKASEWHAALRAGDLDKAMAVTEDLLVLLDSVHAKYTNRFLFLASTASVVLQRPGRHLQRIGELVAEVLSVGKQIGHPDSDVGKGLINLERMYKDAVQRAKQVK